MAFFCQLILLVSQLRIDTLDTLIFLCLGILIPFVSKTWYQYTLEYIFAILCLSPHIFKQALSLRISGVLKGGVYSLHYAGI